MAGTLKEVIEEAAEQLGVETAGKKMIDLGAECLDALGLSAAAAVAGAGGVKRLEEWGKRLETPRGFHEGPQTSAGKKAHEDFETRTMVSNALDRAQLYISSMISAGGAPEVKKLAGDFHSLASAMERPMHVDILALAAPSSQVELRLRVMTGDETVVLVASNATIAQVIDAAVSKTGATKDKGRTLVHEGKQLPKQSTLGQHNVVEGTLLTLILTPPVLADGAPNQARTVAQLLQEKDEKFASEGEVRAYGVQRGGVVNKGGNAKMLYARCGGIFGVAGFVDRCMDAWMADPTLNANDAVATWHQRAQRCGFKFLVTQLMGYLCGGPQVYTGRDMAASHKHLNISEEEWGSFIEGMHDVCSEIGLPQQEVEDVTAVIESMRADCIIQDGKAPPANPGHPAPAGDSLYARCGGVYPLALVCDRLVDALLSDESVKIKVDAERTMPSLKYLFTEFVCAIAGGPETMTAPSIAATRLQVSSQDLFKLLGSVASSADHLEPPTLAAELTQRLYDAADLILVAPIKWDAPVACSWVDPFANAPHASVDTHGAMNRMLASISVQVKIPLLYVPSGKAGFLLALEHGAGDEAKAQRSKLTTSLGFEDTDGMPGVAMIPPSTDKDMVLLIDTSGSMMGSRIIGATDNALKIYDKFTDEHDHLGLIHFHHEFMVKLPLQPRIKSGSKGWKRQWEAIDNTRRPEWGRTAFYDALIKAVNIKVRVDRVQRDRTADVAAPTSRRTPRLVHTFHTSS